MHDTDIDSDKEFIFIFANNMCFKVKKNELCKTSITKY